MHLNALSVTKLLFLFYFINKKKNVQIFFLRIVSFFY